MRQGYPLVTRSATPCVTSATNSRDPRQTLPVSESPSTDSHPTARRRPRRTPVISGRGLLVALNVLVGALHFLVADTRGSGWDLEGIGLAAVGIVAIGIGLALVRTSARSVLIASTVVNVAIIASLILTRTSGYPFGPFEGVAAPLGAYETLVLITSSITVSVSGVTSILGRRHLGSPGLRFDTLAPVAIVAAALPGLAMSSWSDDAAYFAGTTHVHGGTTVNSSTQHGFAYRAELTPVERRALGEQLTLARTAALATPTLADARAAGWSTVGDPVPGGGQMTIDIERRTANTTFDPSSPVALLFASAADDAPIIAVQYEAWTKSTTPPVGFTGQDIFWHLHTGTCLVDDLRFVHDEPHVGAKCELLGGVLTNTISWMIRAWVVPGWENPNGTFAHDHPGVR